MVEWISSYQQWLSESESLNNAQLVANHFSSGWSPEAISALCGNMRHESSINPDMYEYGYSWESDRGYGLVQWTPRSKYWDWAVSKGLEPRNGNSQLARIDYEVENNIQWIPIADYNYMTFAEFRANSGNWSVDYLTEAFTWSYERPNAQAGQDSMLDRKTFAARVFKEVLFGEAGTVHFIFPTDALVTSEFRSSDRPDHHGVDFAADGINEIKASGGGVVSKSYVSSSYGEVVYIKTVIDGVTWEHVYAHLETGSRTVFEGDSVTQGQVIGIMGNTGDSTGQHLHFELHKGGWNDVKSNAVDPLLYLGVSTGGGGGAGNPKQDKMKQYITLMLTDTLNGWKW